MQQFEIYSVFCFLPNLFGHLGRRRHTEASAQPVLLAWLAVLTVATSSAPSELQLHTSKYVGIHVLSQSSCPQQSWSFVFGSRMQIGPQEMSSKRHVDAFRRARSESRILYHPGGKGCHDRFERPHSIPLPHPNQQGINILCVQSPATTRHNFKSSIFHSYHRSWAKRSILIKRRRW